ncbi:MAG: MmcQ/YjbR family DNA-binding protein [Dehalococcoidia bacterium]
MRRSDAIARLGKICGALPDAHEKAFGGHTAPTWRVRDKIFAMTGERGRPNVTCKAPPGAQAVLVGAEPDRYFVPPYVGHNGWVGAWLDVDVDWDVIAGLVEDSYRMTAPKRLLAGLDGAAPKSAKSAKKGR